MSQQNAIFSAIIPDEKAVAVQLWHAVREERNGKND